MLHLCGYVTGNFLAIELLKIFLTVMDEALQQILPTLYIVVYVCVCVMNVCVKFRYDYCPWLLGWHHCSPYMELRDISEVCCRRAHCWQNCAEVPSPFLIHFSLLTNPQHVQPAAPVTLCRHMKVHYINSMDNAWC